MSTDSAWDAFAGWITQAGQRVRVLPVEPQRGLKNAHALGVTPRSSLWAMATNVGALFIDDGWVRVLGGGALGLRADLASWNGLSATPTFATSPGLFVVGFDVLGGVFALDGGAIGEGRGQVFYFAPDSLSWEPMGMGYTQWVEWLLTAPKDVDAWFDGQRWPGWRDEVRPLDCDTAITAYPFTWTEQGKDLSRTTRAPVPAVQVVSTAFGFAREFGEPTLPGPRRAPH